VTGQTGPTGWTGTTGSAGPVGVAGTLSGLVAVDGTTDNSNTKGAAGIETVIVTLATVVASEPTSYYIREFSAITGSTPRSIHKVSFYATFNGEDWTVNAEVKYYDPDDTFTTTITVKGYYKLT
jgi:hypothetical protein